MLEPLLFPVTCSPIKKYTSTTVKKCTYLYGDFAPQRRKMFVDNPDGNKKMHLQDGNKTRPLQRKHRRPSRIRFVYWGLNERCRYQRFPRGYLRGQHWKGCLCLLSLGVTIYCLIFESIRSAATWLGLRLDRQ